MEIKDVVLKLIGQVKPIGESNEDDFRFENLKNLCELTEQLVCVINEIAYRYRDSYQYSIKRAGEYAFKFIDKNLNIKD